VRVLQLLGPDGKIEAAFLIDPTLPLGETKLLQPKTIHLASTAIRETHQPEDDEDLEEGEENDVD